MLKIFILVFLALSFNLKAEPIKLVNNDYLIGEGLYEYFKLDIYYAKFFAKEKTFSYQKPFALELTYQRNLYGKKIAERSIKEMKKQGLNNKNKEEKWLDFMIKSFPDVKKNDKITGIYDGVSITYFYHNNNLTNQIKDKEFGQRFFGIWLNENTSAKKLRHKLLGIDN